MTASAVSISESEDGHHRHVRRRHVVRRYHHHQAVAGGSDHHAGSGTHGDAASGGAGSGAHEGSTSIISESSYYESSPGSAGHSATGGNGRREVASGSSIGGSAHGTDLSGHMEQGPPPPVATWAQDTPSGAALAPSAQQAWVESAAAQGSEQTQAPRPSATQAAEGQDTHASET